MKELTENIDMLIRTVPVLLLQFGSDTCGPCHAIRFKLNQWLEEHSGVTARYVDIEKNQALSSQMGIFSVPAILVFTEGHAAVKECGYFSLDTILERLEYYLELHNEEKEKC